MALDAASDPAALTLSIVDQHAGRTLMQRSLFTVNAATCLYGVTMQPADTLDWPTGTLQYSV